MYMNALISDIKYSPTITVLVSHLHTIGVLGSGLGRSWARVVVHTTNQVFMLAVVVGLRGAGTLLDRFRSHS